MNQQFNRMEPEGPNRQEIQKMLRNDRRIMTSIVMSAVDEVLSREYGFEKSELDDFHEQVKKEITSK